MSVVKREEIFMNADREKAILEIVIREKCVTVKQLAKELYASEPSIRRDLNNLAGQRLLRRTHGGAVLDETALSEIKVPFLIREFEQADEKAKIAAVAAQMIHDGDTVFLDASTSAYTIIPLLREKRDLVVLTNGIRALSKLSEYNINCIGTGGKVINSSLAFSETDAIETIKRYNADICFFSCRGLADDGRITDISAEENAVRRYMIEYSEKAYLLCTCEKLNKLYYNNLCWANNISGVLCPKGLPDRIRGDAPEV